MKLPAYLLTVVMTVSLWSCSDGVIEEMQNVSEPTTRASIPPKRSPGINFDIGGTIEIGGIGTVLLPWWSGANTQVPVDVLKDHQQRDGWVLLYNLCTPVGVSRFGNSTPYIILYNVFTGQMRGYAYVNTDVTGGNATFWQLSINGNTYLTNDFDSVIIAKDAGFNQNNVQIVSNLTRTPAKSLARGWNCFDFDMAIYDPEIRGRITTMNIDVFDATNLKINLGGESFFQTDGTIVSMSSNSSVPFDLDNWSGKAAEIGTSALTKLLGIGGLASGGISSLVSNGVQNLVEKFIGKETVSTDTNFVKLTTKGNLKITGTITGNSQSNFPSVSRLGIPGAKQLYIPDDYAPYYDKPLGVFYIAKTPTLKVVYKNVSFVKTNDQTPPVHGEGGSNFSRNKVYFTYIVGNDEPLEVVLNPELESLIDHYTVSTAIVGDVSGYERSTNSDGWSLGINENAHIYGDTFVSEQEGTSGKMIYTKEYPSTVSIPNDYTEAQEYYSRYQNLVPPTMPSNLGLKVSITLYPKAPQYNPTPIVITRTVKCNIERP